MKTFTVEVTQVVTVGRGDDGVGNADHPLSGLDFGRVLAVVAEMLLRDRVALHGAELAFHPNERKIICNGEAAIVEQDMMIGTQAQQIFGCVGAVVWPTERLNVCTLCIRPPDAIETGIADLAAEAVQFLDGAAYGCVPDNALNGRRDATSPIFTARCYLWRGGAHCDKPETAHLKAVSADFVPIAFDPVEPIISIAGFGSELFVLSTTEDADRQALQAAYDQGGVAPGVKCLVFRLSCTVTASAASMARVYDNVTVIFVVWVSTRQNNRSCASFPVSSDAGVRARVPAFSKKRSAILEDCAQFRLRNAFAHQLPPGESRKGIATALISQIEMLVATPAEISVWEARAA